MFICASFQESHRYKEQPSEVTKQSQVCLYTGDYFRLHLAKTDYKTKKPFIHNRDEEFSPRDHPVSVEGSKVASCRFFLQQGTFQHSNALDRANGLFRHWLLEFTGEVSPFRGDGRVRSDECAPDGRCAGLPPHSPNSLTG